MAGPSRYQWNTIPNEHAATLTTNSSIACSMLECVWYELTTRLLSFLVRVNFGIGFDSAALSTEALVRSVERRPKKDKRDLATYSEFCISNLISALLLKRRSD